MNSRTAAAPRRILPASPFNKPAGPPQPAEHYVVDDLVSHDRHGLGRVTQVEYDAAIWVDFGSGQAVRVAVTSGKLIKL